MYQTHLRTCLKTQESRQQDSFSTRKNFSHVIKSWFTVYEVTT